MNTLNAHSIGCNSVSWAPSSIPGSLLQTSPTSGTSPKRFASGGCDNIVKIWKEDEGVWKEEFQLQGHSDWVRDVSFAPSLGPRQYLASCSQVTHY
jgi:protein transport protein SEC13